MKKLLVLMFLCTVGAFSQVPPGQCVINGVCDLSNGSNITSWLYNYDIYPTHDCDSPNCPGLKRADFYYLFEYNEPCGDMECYYCLDCASLAKPGVHVAMKCPVKKPEVVKPLAFASHTHITLIASLKIPNTMIKTVTLSPSRRWWKG